MTTPLYIITDCNERLVPRVRYVLDTMLMARGIPVTYVAEPPSSGPWLRYAPAETLAERRGCIGMHHAPEAWEFPARIPEYPLGQIEALPVISAQRSDAAAATIPFDLVANAFYFLSSWAERSDLTRTGSRGFYADSVYSRCDVPQDIVDRYLDHLIEAIVGACEESGVTMWPDPAWPHSADYGIVLSHDVDFIPRGVVDTAKQGVKTILRHLVRQRDPIDAARAARGLLAAIARRRDAYGCVPEIIAEEKRRGVQASFQVAVGHRHPYDVNYRIEDASVRNYLRSILDEGFELCLHGSYRSTEVADWYLDEVETLTCALARPVGSRQHFLSFDYDTLFSAQERAAIRYDMSMGFPDRVGPRAGFSYPYFPYSLAQERPYNVVQISLFLMDVTLRGYMDLKGEAAWRIVESELDRVKAKRGSVSVVWHPIVFGGARDPGYDKLFWRLVEHVRQTNGLATDGRTINDHWRARARSYSSFPVTHPPN